MDIRNSLDGLKSLLGVNPTAPPHRRARTQLPRPSEQCARQRSCHVEQCGKRGFAGSFGRRRAHGQSCSGAGGAGCGNVRRAASAVASKMVDADAGRRAVDRGKIGQWFWRGRHSMQHEREARRDRSGAEGADGRGFAGAGAPGYGPAGGVGALVPGAEPEARFAVKRGRGAKCNWREQAREAAADMAVFARVLDATRANLHVMNRLRELRMGRLEYSERQARGGIGARSPSTGSGRWSGNAEAGHGDH